MVKFSDPIQPNPEWKQAYRDGLQRFEEQIRMVTSNVREEAPVAMG